MKIPILSFALLIVASAFGANPPKGATDVPAAGAQTERRHPLRGVITVVHADRSAIMVKHEAIPGVMRAMTMLFRVDDATLKSVEKGQSITAVMSRRADEWWLHDVKVVANAPAK